MKPWGRIAFWIVVAAQLVFLIGFIVVKEADLRIGTEVVLQTVPVDPRSLLQGDYAILDYEIARLPLHLQQLEVGDTVYVGLKRGPEIWTASGYTVARSDVVGTYSSRAEWTAGAMPTLESERILCRKGPATSLNARMT